MNAISIFYKDEQYEIDKIYTFNAFAGYALQPYLQICVCPLKA